MVSDGYLVSGEDMASVGYMVHVRCMVRIIYIYIVNVGYVDFFVLLICLVN